MPELARGRSAKPFCVGSSPTLDSQLIKINMALEMTFPSYYKLITKNKISYYKVLQFNIITGFKIESYSFTKDKVTKGSFKINIISDNWKSIDKEEFEQIEEHYNSIQQLYQNTLKQFSQFVFNLNS